MAPAVDPVELGGGRMLLDLRFRDQEGLVASYVLPEPDGRFAVVETGPGSCAVALDEGVRRAGVHPAAVDRVFVTHIHLDHAGGAGAVLRRYPNARIFVHRKGAPHLRDPGRLVASARRAWGPAADRLWGDVQPAADDRVFELGGGERFDLIDGPLEVLATPGHASHHLSFFDVRRRALLTGDSAGVRLPGSWRARPAVPPPDLDLEALFDSVNRMEALDPREVWYSHYGPRTGGVSELEQYRVAVEQWRDAALQAAKVDPSVAHVAEAVAGAEAQSAARAGARPSDEERGVLVSGYELAAQGLLRYFRQHRLLPE